MRIRVRVRTLIRLCRTGQACCVVAALGGIAWLFNLCIETVSAPADFTLAWLFWQVGQMLLAMGVFYGAEKLNDELIYTEQELEDEAYKAALYHGLVPQDRRHDA